MVKITHPPRSTTSFNIITYLVRHKMLGIIDYQSLISGKLAALKHFIGTLYNFTNWTHGNHTVNRKCHIICFP